jgi:2-oxoglutarate ferredoxin oxidoreductase subunit alpha
VARRHGVRAGLFRPRTLWPFPDRELRAAAGQARAVVVAEMNMGQMAHEVERVVAGRAPVTRCLRADGQPMAPADVLSALGVPEGAAVAR